MYCATDNNATDKYSAQWQDMTDQELEFARMANEISDYNSESSTFRMYLQYCPDAITYLLDRCLMNECNEQVILFETIFLPY